MKIKGNDMLRIHTSLKVALLTWKNNKIIGQNEVSKFQKLYDSVDSFLIKNKILKKTDSLGPGDPGDENDYGGPKNCEECD
ncbi:MAG: hypothetical protein CMB80_28610 [Flammeovirgaceae bacterium]|nr:hypothetical protein [Flammeovirgaceae bacterium]|tara:strand:- start:318 stop:560 length:243 start_codon:yes stop_codon:yes gene_type:complete